MLFTAYAIVRTVPSANRPNRREKKMPWQPSQPPGRISRDDALQTTERHDHFRDIFEEDGHTPQLPRTTTLWSQHSFSFAKNRHLVDKIQ